MLDGTDGDSGADADAGTGGKRGPARSRYRGLPCLPVEDVGAAVAYYQRFLGFHLVRMAGDPPSAVVGRDGSAIVLRPSEPSEPPRRAGVRTPRAFDAVVALADLDTVFEDLSVQGVSVHSPPAPHPVLGRTFTIQDRFGNMLCFAEAPDRIGPALRRRARAARRRVRSARFARVAAAELRPHLTEFQRFYERLPDKRDIYYMFFTGGLLHWAAKAASYVPAEVNLVLIGSDLSADERAWVTANLDRPFHHIDLHVNDWPIWDFLFETNRASFGWLDIDCLVLEPGIFAELSKVPSDAAVNCLWSYDSGFGFRVANTYLAFVNTDAIQALRSRRIPVWARPHDWRGGDRSEQAGKKCFYRVPSARERRLMLQVVPPDGRGRPRPPGSHAFFDTLSIYQILARGVGFRTNQVRDLDNPMLAAVRPGELPSREPQGMSDEVIHVGGISYYREFFHDPAVRIRYLAADYATLTALAPRLPRRYGEQRVEVIDELRAFGVEPDAAETALREYLRTVGGLSVAAVDRALSIPTR